MATARTEITTVLRLGGWAMYASGGAAAIGLVFLVGMFGSLCQPALGKPQGPDPRASRAGRPPLRDRVRSRARSGSRTSFREYPARGRRSNKPQAASRLVMPRVRPCGYCCGALGGTADKVSYVWYDQGQRWDPCRCQN